MKKINSLLVADSILSLLNTFDIDNKENMFVENWINGREQGFAIINPLIQIKGQSLKITFAESRNSDEIIVTTNEKDFGTQNFFNTINDAVVFIQSKLNQ